MSLLFKPNELIATIGKLKLDRLARHLGNYFFEHAQKKICFDFYDGSTFRMNIKDLNAEAGVSSKNYKEIEKALKSLQQPVEMRTRDNKRFLSLVMIPEVSIDWTTGEYYFALSPSTIELLKSSTKRFFTKLELLEMNPLESKHSHIIIEWLKRYAQQEKSPMPIDELRQITDTANSKAYDNFSNIKTRILDVAVKEINEKTPYEASYEAIKSRAKTRPKVTKLLWTFKRKEEQSDKTNKPQDPIMREIEEVRQKYADLAERYVTDHICATEEEFYQATYRADYDCLKWFHNDKKIYKTVPGKIERWLYTAIEKGEKRGRLKEQLDKYYELLDKLPEEVRKTCWNSQSHYGFYEQILLIKRYLNDTTPVDKPSKLKEWL